MTVAQESLKVQFMDGDGQPVAIMEIYPEGPSDTAIPLIVEESPETAAEYAEARVQLLEMAAYEYDLDRPGCRLRSEPGIVRPSRTPKDRDRGRITPGLNVGRMRFTLLDAVTECEKGSAEVEVRAAKVGYRDDYRHMLRYITDRCTDLLLEFRSPAQHALLPDDTRDPETLCQRFAFVSSPLASRKFRDAVQRITALPHRLWEQETCDIPINRGVKPTAAVARQIASASRRVPLPAGHPLASRLSSVPEHVTITRNVETLDTAENRFVKHALRTFQAFVAEIRERLENIGRDGDERFTEEALAMEEELAEVVSRDFFREVSEPRLLPLGSPVLQRKGGYGEILAAWLQFDMAARLCWSGGADVYGAGKRDVATLYEYWLFFRLLGIVAETFHLDEPPAKSLIAPTADGFGLCLKAGRYIPLSGEFVSGGRRLKIKFSYNRLFTRANGGDPEKNFPAPGSWTERMKPDYTLTLWPSGFTEEEAERQEVIVHVHFDAKYRVKDLPGMFGTPDEQFPDKTAMDADLAEDKAAQKEGKYRRADLLKMHAYKDAIRRTAGAYVLYPGTQNRNWQGFHEIIPGLGAFGIRPVEEGDDGTAALRAFISQVVNHVCDRATQRERETYHRYDIHRSAPTDHKVREIPEQYIGSIERHLPADDTAVIKGFIRPAACRVCREKGVFYFHAVDGRGRPTDFDPLVLKAHYLFPYTENAKWVGWYAPINRCELVTERSLEEILGRGILVHKRAYYYLIRLVKSAIGDITEYPTVSPPAPGAPTLCSWADLYSKRQYDGR